MQNNTKQTDPGFYGECKRRPGEISASIIDSLLHLPNKNCKRDEISYQLTITFPAIAVICKASGRT